MKPAAAAAVPVAVETVVSARRVERLVAGQPTSDGAGVRLMRVLTQPLQRRLDPFLMLDNFRSDDPDDWIAGFPDHPHRGFETVTYMIAGRMRHRDSAGHEGLLEGGGVQWMTAGRGVIHSELPEQSEGLMEGFQLWLNLPSKDKMREPWYRDFTAAELPAFETADGVRVVAIAGRSHGVDGAVRREGTEPLYLDLHLPEGARFAQALPPGPQRVRLPVPRRDRSRRHRGALGPDGGAVERAGHRRRRAARAGRAGARAADRGAAPRRADRPVRPVRDEHRRPDPRGGARLPGRPARLIATGRPRRCGARGPRAGPGGVRAG